MTVREPWSGSVALESESSAARFEVQVLGPVVVLRNGGPVDLRGKPTRLLALLAACAGDVLSVDGLIDGLWGEHPPTTARKAVHVNVSHVRSALGEEFPLETVLRGYVLRRDDLSIDADRFSSAVDRAAAQIDASPRSAVRTLEDALALWRGDAYAGLEDSEPLHAEIVRLNEQRVRASRLLLDARLRLGHHAEVIGELAAATAEHPYDEGLRALHMLALYRSGRQTDALRAFDRTREVLVDAGLEPSPELQQLYDDVLHQRARLDSPGEVSPVSRRAGNLPEPRSELIGRDVQLSRVEELLDDYRLLTLTGVGGVGKTSLAIAAGSRVGANYPDGCWLVELGNVLGDDQVTNAFLNCFGVQPQGTSQPLDALVDALAGLRLLVVVDNCEHVLRGAAEVADRLLNAGAGIAIMATSREGLGVRGEYQLTVPSLETLGPDSQAADLFRQRARENGWEPDDGDDAVIGELCARLDGIPLAIELAAARARSMTVPQLYDRLADRFRLLKGARHGVDRHQTLQATLAWSYALLDEDEKVLFDRLCVFTGPFDLTAAEQVLSDDQRDELSISEHLGSLVNKSMLAADRGSFHLMETMRQFSEHQAGADDLARTRDKHSEYYASFVVDAHDGHLGPEEEAWNQRLEAAWPNVRAAIGWALATAKVGAALSMVGHLGHGQFNSRHPLEVYEWALAAIELPDAEGSEFHASCVGVAAMGLALQGDLERALPLAQRAVAARAEHGDDFDQLALGSLAIVLMVSGQLHDAERLFEERVETGSSSHRTLQAAFVNDVALHQVADLRHAEAFATATRALALARETQNPTAIARSLLTQGMAVAPEHPLEAIDLFDEALAVAAAGSATWITAFVRQAKSHALMDVGSATDALELALSTGWLLLRRGDLWFASDSVFACARGFGALHDLRTATLLFGASLWADPTDFRGRRRRSLRAQCAEGLGETLAAELIEEGRALSVHQALDLAETAGASLLTSDPPGSNV